MHYFYLEMHKKSFGGRAPPVTTLPRTPVVGTREGGAGQEGCRADTEGPGGIYLRVYRI